MPKEICRICKGSGKKSKNVKCSRCKGTGYRQYIIRNDKRIYTK